MGFLGGFWELPTFLKCVQLEPLPFWSTKPKVSLRYNFRKFRFWANDRKKKMGLEHSNYLWNLGETFLCERLGGFQIFPISFQKSRKHIPLYRWKFLPLSLAEVDKISSLLLIHVMTQRTMMFRADASRNIRGSDVFFFGPKGQPSRGNICGAWEDLCERLESKNRWNKHQFRW